MRRCEIGRRPLANQPVARCDRRTEELVGLRIGGRLALPAVCSCLSAGAGPITGRLVRRQAPLCFPRHPRRWGQAGEQLTPVIRFECSRTSPAGGYRMLRSVPTTPLAFLLLVCILPAAGHLGACATQHSNPADDVCSSVCCQSFAVRPVGTNYAPPPPERFEISQAMVRLPVIPSSLFQPPEALL